MSLDIIIEILSTCSNSHSKFIRDLVRENANDLSMFLYERDSPLFSYLAEREVTRASLLLNRVGAVGNERNFLFFAKDSKTSQSLGFAFVLPFWDAEKGGSIVMTAVDSDNRQKGVFTALMSAILSEFNNNVTLSCKPGMTALYRKFGFLPEAVVETQIAMASSPNKENRGRILSVDDEFVMRSPKVLQAQREVQSRLGPTKFDAAIKQWQGDFLAGQNYAKKWLEENSQ